LKENCHFFHSCFSAKIFTKYFSKTIILTPGDYVENILRPEEVGTVMDLNKLKATIDLSRTILAGNHGFGKKFRTKKYFFDIVLSKK
jgi:hypothetical protein